MTDWFKYQARLKRIVDGDTIDVELDLGFRITRVVRLRLADVDTAEIYGVEHESEEYEQGKVHSDFVGNWFDSRQNFSEWPFVVKTDKDSKGKYGRFIATVTAKQDGSTLNDALVDSFPEVES